MHDPRVLVFQQKQNVCIPHTFIYYITNACATGDAVSLNEYDCFLVLFLFIIILDFNYFACICCCYCWFRRHSPPIPYQKKSMLVAAESSQKPSNKKKYDSNYIHKANCTSCAFVFLSISLLSALPLTFDVHFD